MINSRLIASITDNDPLHEDCYMPVKSITHKYKNRVLLLVTLKCHTYCDFCTRERKVHKHSYKTFYQEGVNYIKSHKEIDDVIISGGDPLTLSSDEIKDILLQLKNINHVKVIRIHTKILSHYPQKITEEMIESLSVVNPLFINLHISALEELHGECIEAIIKLRNAGFILGSQSVLLRGINDDENHLSELFTKLLQLGVKPYYIYQMDRTNKYDKYVVPEKRGIELMTFLRRNLSGMAVPRYILDTKEYKKILL